MHQNFLNRRIALSPTPMEDSLRYLKLNELIWKIISDRLLTMRDLELGNIEHWMDGVDVKNVQRVGRVVTLSKPLETAWSRS